MKAHPVADMFPMMSDGELRALADDIKMNGLREPIVVDDRDWLKTNPEPHRHDKRPVWREAYERAIDEGEIQIVDGRNRYTACKLAGLAFNYDESESGYVIEYRTFGWNNDVPDGDVVAFILSKNIHRRHLTASQRAMVAAKIATLKTGANQHTENSAPSQARVAELLQVSEDSIQSARKVIERGIPELAGAVVKGDVAASVAASVAELPAEQQREAIAGGKKTLTDAAKKAKQRKSAMAPTQTPEPVNPHPTFDELPKINLGRKFWSDLEELLNRKIADGSDSGTLTERANHRRIGEAVKDFVAAQEQAFADLRRACGRAREQVLRDRREDAEHAKWEEEHRRRMAADPVYAARQREIDRLIAEARKASGGLFSHSASNRYDEACKVLGLPDWTGKVTVENTRKAFRALARVHHPDLGGDAAKMTEVNVAYSIVMADFERRGSTDGGA